MRDHSEVVLRLTRCNHADITFPMAFFFQILGPLGFLVCPETNMEFVIIAQPFYNKQAKENFENSIQK